MDVLLTSQVTQAIKGQESCFNSWKDFVRYQPIRTNVAVGISESLYMYIALFALVDRLVHDITNSLSLLDWVNSGEHRTWASFTSALNVFSRLINNINA